MKVKRLTVWATGAVAVGVAVYVLSTPALDVAGPPVLREAGKPQAGHTSHTDGLQWMAAVPHSDAKVQDEQRPFAEVIAALIATRNPADAHTAYGIIEGCEMNRDSALLKLDPVPPMILSYKKRCDSITEVMRRSRFDYLRTAAYAGVPGVGSDWFRQGPPGGMDALQTRPNDPAVIEWKQQALSLLMRDGERGDFNALQDLMNGYKKGTPLFDADPSRALAYATAYQQVVDAMDLGMPVRNQPTDADLAALAANLSPEQVAWAKARADAILAARRKLLAAGG